MNELARDGLTFENAIAPAPQTPESMPVIFTGEFPAQANVNIDLTAQGSRTRSHLGKHRTIPEVLSDAGYSTAGFSTNGYTSRYFGYQSGFDFFEDFTEEETRPGPDINLPSGLKGLWKLARSEEKFRRWEQFDERAIDWARQADEPYFLWIMLMDTHSPYIAPAAYRSENSWLDMFRANWSYWQNNFNDIPEKHRQRLINAYDDTIRYVDAFVGKLTEALAETDPVVVLHGDHGEGFGEHGSYGHGVHLYEEYVRTPLLLSGTGAGERLDTPISLRELKRLLRLVGTDRPSDIVEQYSGKDRYVIAKAEQDNKTMIRTRRWKLITQDTRRDGLYDLRTDPGERQNLIDEREDCVAALQAALSRHGTTQTEKCLISKSAPELS